MKKTRLLVIITIILSIGLWNCASQQATIMEDEFDADSEIDANLADLFEYSDSEIDDELESDDDFMARLAAYEPESTPTEPEPAIVTPPAESEEESLKDVLALLLGEDLDDNTDSSGDEDIFPSISESAAVEEQSATDDFGDYALENDVERLESEYANKNARADSLKRILREKESRLQELEDRQKSGTPAPRRRASAGSGGNAGFTTGYRAARAEFEAKNYDAAMQSFSGLMANYPNHSMADNCQYWIGECYFGKKQYAQAIAEFSKVFSFRRNDKFDDAQLMIALSYLRQGNREQAKTAFESFFSDYADSEYIQVARNLYQKL